MAEVFSQNEINTLLQVVSSGNAELDTSRDDEKPRMVRTFDFKKPDIVSKTRIHMLFKIHENLAGQLSILLSAFMRSMVRVELQSIKQVAYEEYEKTLNKPSMVIKLSVPPLPGLISIEMEHAFAFCIIDRLLGGQGKTTAEFRKPTDIEQTVLKKMVCRMLPGIKEAWNEVVDLSPAYEGIGSGGRSAPVLLKSETVVLVVMSVIIGSIRGMLNLCIPLKTLEPLSDKLNTSLEFSRVTGMTSKEVVSNIQSRIEQAKVDISAELGSANIKVRDLLDLARGDVIQLEKSIESPVEIKVGTITKFLGYPGVIENRLAVQIVQVLNEDGKNE